MSPEEEFGSCLENAESWIRMIQERLEATDNVQGPKAALENRLRESEVILAEEPEGNLRLGRVLVKAESLLQGRSDDEKHEIQAAMKHIKTLWEDTQINMAHCHSRIEWVLLHWSEYLKAREDYFLWLMNMKQKLEPDLELQLGLKEKKLQLSHHTVLLSNILNQAALLERLIQESGSLFAKTEDETVNEAAQQMLKADHEALQMKAKEKVKILEAIVQEHQQYADRREKFQNWLQCMKEKFNNCYTCTGDKNQMERSLTELKELSDAVSSQKGELDNLQVQATAVILNTSPLGAELITKDLEELRADWNSLRLRCQQDQEPLKLGLHSVLETKSRAEQLEREVAKFAEWLQSFDLQPPDDDGMETAWCKCLLTRSSILAEEPRVEEFQLKLKEFCRFSQSEEQLCNKVLSVIQDYKRVKGQIVKRCNQLGSRLRCDFQKFLQEFQQWRNSTESLLHLPLDPDGGPLTMTYLQNVEDHLARSNQLKIQLDRFQGLKGMLDSVYSEEQVATFESKLQEAVQQRTFLNDSLLQRRRKLQARGPDEVIEFRKMNGRDPSDHKLLLKKFEVWLKTEDRKLTSIFAAKSPRSSRERKNRKQGLKVLQSRVPHGQKIFEELLSTEFSGANEEEKQLEDLRYRWILYKTKLKEAEELSARGPDEVIEFRKLHNVLAQILQHRQFLRSLKHHEGSAIICPVPVVQHSLSSCSCSSCCCLPFYCH
ncbi:nesprin-3 isoform X2 [Stegostoma tigrinum]|uniref:nesprin-3 isoform X2 n=1 Tax=Stegostoma tigrinum TaxID=3053191 RepID=UPI00287064AE|nr:nesprin-3 isoform X2 [Stegostoma tigrinum]